MVTARKFTHRNAAQCNAFALHCILCCIVTAHPSNPRAYNTPKLKFLPTVTRSALTLLTNTVTPLNYYVVCSTSRLPHTISRYDLLLVTLITSLGHTTISQHNRSRDAQHATVASRSSLRRKRLSLPYVSTNGSNEFAHSPRNRHIIYVAHCLHIRDDRARCYLRAAHRGHLRTCLAHRRSSTCTIYSTVRHINSPTHPIRTFDPPSFAPR